MPDDPDRQGWADLQQRSMQRLGRRSRANEPVNAPAEAPSSGRGSCAGVEGSHGGGIEVEDAAAIGSLAKLFTQSLGSFRNSFRAQQQPPLQQQDGTCCAKGSHSFMTRLSYTLGLSGGGAGENAEKSSVSPSA